jgi:hypothetical protein
MAGVRGLGVSISLAIVVHAAPARSEPTGPRVELGSGATVNLGLLQRTDPWIARGLALRVLAPRRRHDRAFELAVEWKRFDDAEMDGFTARVDDDRLDRLRLLAGARLRDGRPDRPHGYARLAAGVDLTDGEVRVEYGLGPPYTYETRSGRSAGLVADAAAGYALALGPVSVAIELDVAAGVYLGPEDLSRIHRPGGPFAEAQLLVAVGCALW